MTMVSEIATGTCVPYPNVLQGIDVAGASSPLAASSLSFSLLTPSGSSLADQIAPDQSRWADWTDGLNMLRKDGGHVASKETETFVQALTEIGLKIKLLGKSVSPVWLTRALTVGVPYRFVRGESRYTQRSSGGTPAYELRLLLF